jgi:hypothetical protein
VKLMLNNVASSSVVPRSVASSPRMAGAASGLQVWLLLSCGSSRSRAVPAVSHRHRETIFLSSDVLAAGSIGRTPANRASKANRLHTSRLAVAGDRLPTALAPARRRVQVDRARVRRLERGIIASPQLHSFVDLRPYMYSSGRIFRK